MKRFFSLFVICSLLVSACNLPEDKAVAEVSNYKLYLSEVLATIPENITSEDSVIRVQTYIENWVKEKIILSHAKQSLTYSEKQFDKELAAYHNQLLMEAYYKKITTDSRFNVTNDELQEFIKQYAGTQSISREVVKVNYVKLSKNSRIANQIKEILFDDEKRVQGREKLEILCADSIEYYIDSDTWLLLDYVESEFPFDIKDREQLLSKNKYIDVVDDNYRYLLVFLDFKVQQLSSEAYEISAIAKKMLLQQKKVEYINNLKDSLYQEYKLLN